MSLSQPRPCDSEPQQRTGSQEAPHGGKGDEPADPRYDQDDPCHWPVQSNRLGIEYRIVVALRENDCSLSVFTTTATRWAVKGSVCDASGNTMKSLTRISSGAVRRAISSDPAEEAGSMLSPRVGNSRYPVTCMPKSPSPKRRMAHARPTDSRWATLRHWSAPEAELCTVVVPSHFDILMKATSGEHQGTAKKVA